MAFLSCSRPLFVTNCRNYIVTCERNYVSKHFRKRGMFRPAREDAIRPFELFSEFRQRARRTSVAKCDAIVISRNRIAQFRLRATRLRKFTLYKLSVSELCRVCVCVCVRYVSHGRANVFCSVCGFLRMRNPLSINPRVWISIISLQSHVVSQPHTENVNSQISATLSSAEIFFLFCSSLAVTTLNSRWFEAADGGISAGLLHPNLDRRRSSVTEVGRTPAAYLFSRAPGYSIPSSRQFADLLNGENSTRVMRHHDLSILERIDRVYSNRETRLDDIVIAFPLLSHAVRPSLFILSDV